MFSDVAAGVITVDAVSLHIPENPVAIDIFLQRIQENNLHGFDSGERKHILKKILQTRCNDEVMTDERYEKCLDAMLLQIAQRGV